MLRSRLTTLLAATLAVCACGGTDDGGGALRENLVEPGVTAIEQGGTADRAACEIEASSLRTAMESYALLENAPAADEAALVDAGFLRSESTLWDIENGALVAQDPGCANVETDIESAEIVTDTQPLEADDVYRSFTPDEVAAVGGRDCAWELARIVAASDAFLDDRGEPPVDLGAIVDGGYLVAPTLWTFDAGELVPAEGSPCTALG